MIATGTRSSSIHRKSTMEGSPKKPWEVDSGLIFSVFTVVTPKTHLYPFGSLKYPLLRYLCQGYTGLPGGNMVGWICCLTLLSSTQAPVQKTVGMPLSLHKSRWVLCPYNLMASGYTVLWSLPKSHSSVDLMFQAIKSTQSRKPGHPFPLPGQK